jgi:septum formation protein
MPKASPDRIILASGSPRRAELARAEGWNVEIMPPPETVEAEAAPQGLDETLEEFVVRLAQAKAAAVIAARTYGTILACDTLSEVDGVPLGKPKDREDARRMLIALSGRQHRVVSGVCLWDVSDGSFTKEPLTGHAESVLVLPPLDEEFIANYLDTGLWQGKAGACGFQDGHIPLELVTGTASNVVGLPLELVRAMLGRL